MHIVDSCGWLEWFADGPLADQYLPFLRDSRKILVPVIVIYEVYKILKREIGEEKALLAVGHMRESEAISLDSALALAAADVSAKHHLAMADAIVYASSLAKKCPLVTSDKDLQGLPSVTFIQK